MGSEQAKWYRRILSLKNTEMARGLGCEGCWLLGFGVKGLGFGGVVEGFGYGGVGFSWGVLHGHQRVPDKSLK